MVRLNDIGAVGMVRHRVLSFTNQRLYVRIERSERLAFVLLADRLAVQIGRRMPRGRPR